MVAGAVDEALGGGEGGAGGVAVAAGEVEAGEAEVGVGFVEAQAAAGGEGEGFVEVVLGSELVVGGEVQFGAGEEAAWKVVLPISVVKGRHRLANFLPREGKVA